MSNPPTALRSHSSFHDRQPGSGEGAGPWFHGAYLVIIEDGTELRMSRGQRLKLWDRLNQT
jgi:hypothetical protein